MKFRLSRARGVYRRILLDSTGTLVPLVDYQIRKSELVPAATGGFTHAPEMDFHLREEIKGQYFRLCEGGLYDIYHGGVAWDDFNPIFIPDNEDFISGDPVDPPDGWFGEGGDGTYTLDGTQDTVSGLFTKDSAVQYTLLRDAFFTDLTINATITLKTGGYRLFVRDALIVNGTIDNSGNMGNPGSHAGPINGGGAQAGGTAGASGYLSDLGAGGAGKEGANAGPGNPGDPGAANGFAIATTGGAVGGAGGAGGGGGAGGAGGLQGTNTAAPVNSGGQRHFIGLLMNRVMASNSLNAFQVYRTSGGGGGGGAGGGGTGRGGGGGPAGGNGGYIVVVAKTITGTGTIRSLGGNGQTGGNGDGTGGGGGGGAGGNGGIVVVIYNSIAAGVVLSASGGTGGIGGNHGLTGGNDGNVGGDGPAGTVFQFTAV